MRELKRMREIVVATGELGEVEQREIVCAYGLKLVPWISWDEWLLVYRSLFSSSPISLSSALSTISTWRSRGCLPITVEVTATIVEIQQRDHHLRKCHVVDATKECSDAPLTKEMLAMLYCMAIIRLVNGVVEKTRKRRKESIATAAAAVGLPRTLIDIRHEGSHRELPALQVVRSAAAKALDWLVSYYWEPQRKSIPFQGDSATKIRKRIESKLQKLAFCLKAKETETSQSSSPSSLKGKCDKKQITKILKNFLGLYSSCSSEVVSVLLDFLLKALDSTISMELSVEPLVYPSADSLLEDWKPVIKEFSLKKPEIVLSLVQAVLNMIEIQENMKYETGTKHFKSDANRKIQQVDHLSSLFTWLIRILKQLKPHRRKDSIAQRKSSSAEVTIPKAILMNLLHKCLTLSASGSNKLLMNSTADIIQLIGEGDPLLKKLKKLSSLVLSISEITYHDEEDLSGMTSKNLLVEQDELILSQAAKKLDLIKSLRKKRKALEITTEGDIVSSRRWVLSKNWNPCPIGVLPNSVGFSGCLPFLGNQDGSNKIPETFQERENLESSRYGQTKDDSNFNNAREFGESSFKKSRIAEIEGERVNGGNEDVSIYGDVNGQLMICQVWTKVGEEDLLAIKSSVRLVV